MRQLLLLLHVSVDEHLRNSEHVLDAKEPYDTDDLLESMMSELVLATEICRGRCDDEPRVLEDLLECDKEPHSPYADEDFLDWESVVVDSDPCVAEVEL